MALAPMKYAFGMGKQNKAWAIVKFRRAKGLDIIAPQGIAVLNADIYTSRRKQPFRPRV